LALRVLLVDLGDLLPTRLKQSYAPSRRTFCPALGGGLDDPILGQPEVVLPALHMEPCWPALPPSGEGGIGGKAQRVQQLCEKPFKIGIARLCILLLLYRFT